MDWLVEDWFPRGNRGIDAAPEGNCKTIWGAYWDVCIAAEHDILGHKVTQGNVLIIDEETPKPMLEALLNRFSQSLGYKSYHQLPITLLSMEGFRFGRKTPLDYFLDVEKRCKPIFIRMDSYIAMLPGGRQGLSENNSESGIAVRDNLHRMMDASPGCNTLLAAHSGKPIAQWTLEEIAKHDMQDLVRGHASLVGEACDTGFILKKLSEHPDPLRFAVQTRARRGAVKESGNIIYVEMQEEAYGKGAAKLVRIAPLSPPPSKLVKELFKFFTAYKSYHSWQEIAKQSALYTRKQNQVALDELLQHKVILNHDRPFTYMLNPRYKKVCDTKYIGKLK